MALDRQQPEVRELLSKYQKKLKQELGEEKEGPRYYSREYLQFKKENMPLPFTLYEKACNISEKIFKIAPDPKKAKLVQDSINTCHLNITPTGATSISLLAPMLFILIGLFFSVLLPIMTGGEIAMSGVMLFFVIGVTMIFIITKIPEFLVNTWRLKASNEMVLTIFYVVTYMRHTSNLEKAIEFASDHLTGPISLDLKKVLWDVETEKFESIKVALDKYLNNWKDTNMEFVESFHLIISSLYESSEGRRLDMLDKSLDVMLTETYEKMLHYGHNLKSPITMLHMLGIILPILGLVILPLVASFMTKNVSPIKLAVYIAVIYNLLIPLVVFYFSKTILSKRPTGYGETDISKNPKFSKYKNFIINIGSYEISISPIWICIIVAGILLFIGITPLLMHAASNTDIVIGHEGVQVVSLDTPEYGTYSFHMLGYLNSESGDGKVGPYGLGATILSLCIPLAFGLGLGLYYKFRTGNLIKIRDSSKKLEEGFGSALFQLGNRLGDGLPAEIAFGKVSDVMEGTTAGSFFGLVSMNIRKLGMSVKDAIFNKKIGALTQFPSNIIESSMKVLIESVKKGPKIAAQALVNVARYIKEIHRVNERMRDLMSDITSSMKSQISFLTPVIAGIVVGIMSMVSYILSHLRGQLEKLSTTGGTGSAEQFSGIVSFFGDGIPTFYMQVIVGIYVIQIIILLTILLNGIQNGSDKLNQRNLTAKNLLKSTFLYIFITLAVVITFNMVAASIITGAIG